MHIPDLIVSAFFSNHFWFFSVVLYLKYTFDISLILEVISTYLYEWKMNINKSENERWKRQKKEEREMGESQRNSL